MDEHSLAYEMLKEIKASNRRLFIITAIEVVIIISMFAGFLIYENQFDYVTDIEQTQETENVNSSELTQSIN